MKNSTNDLIEEVEKQLSPVREKLLCHPLYQRVNERQDLIKFMEVHVFCVWDFMSLLKRLQIHFSTPTLPWCPPTCNESLRLINEIMCAEESDIHFLGGHSSHFELYLDAMRSCGADHSFFQGLNTENAFSKLETEPLAKCIREATSFHINEAKDGHILSVAALFTFARENIIPDMFTRLLHGLASKDEKLAPLRYYLERHIELDGDEHGPAANKLFLHLAEKSPEQIPAAIAAARKSMQVRIKLWDLVLSRINAIQTQT